MAINRQKIIATAQKHIQKGSLKKAIREYERIIQVEPDDVRILLKIGDLHARAGQTEAATRTYHEVADHYVANGFFLKAVAVYKQLLRLQPDDVEIKVRLADLYYQLSLLSDALAYYEQVAKHYQQDGDATKYQELMERMITIDPERVGNRIKLAEQYSKTGDIVSAARHFEAACDLLHEAGRFDDYVKVAERYVFHRPDDAERLKQLARVYLDLESHRKALARMQQAFKLNAEDPESVSLIVDALIGLGEEKRAEDVLRGLIASYTAPSAESAKSVAMRRLAELDPSVDTPQVELLDETPEASADVQQEQIRTLIEEVDVYIKYGLHEKAFARIKAGLDIDPNDTRLLERKKDTHLAAGQDRAATYDLMRLAKIVHASAPGAAAAYLAEAEKLHPGNADLADTRRELNLPASTPPAREPIAPVDTGSRPAMSTPVPAVKTVPVPEGSSGQLASTSAAFDDFDALFGADDDEGETALDSDPALVTALRPPVEDPPADEEPFGSPPVGIVAAITPIRNLIAQRRYDDARDRTFELLDEHPMFADYLMIQLELLHQLDDVDEPAPDTVPVPIAADGRAAAAPPPPPSPPSPPPGLQFPPPTPRAIARPTSAQPPPSPAAVRNIPLPTPPSAQPAAPPAIDPSVDAPIGRASSKVTAILTASSRVLEAQSGSPLAEAIQQRLDGNGMMAMMDLQELSMGADAEVATFELAICNMEMGMYFDTTTTIEPMLQDSKLPPADHALVRYYLGIAYEALDQNDEAATHFETILPNTQRFPDVPTRIARLRG